MSGFVRVLLAVAFAVVFVAAADARAADIIAGPARVIDGDTIEVDGVHVRLFGIDAPEKKQPFGEKAKTNLSTLAYNRTAEADCRKTDRYRRKVCVVFVGNKDVGLEQIKVGMAWWYQQYSKEQSRQERSDYEQAESLAKRHRYGLWSGPNPTPPWEWRHNGRQR